MYTHVAIGTKRFTVVLILLILALFLMSVLSISIGSSRITLDKVFEVLLSGNVDRAVATIVQLRYVRTVAAILSGALLGLSGLLMQTVSRNPLADPYIFGLSSTALTAVALGIIMNPSIMVNSAALTATAFIGSLLGYALTMFLSKLAEGNAMSMVLSGIAVAATFSGISHILLYQVQRTIQMPYYFLLLGTVSYVISNEVPYLLLSLIVGVALSLLMFKPLNLYIYGDSYVKQYGYSPRTVAFIAAGVASLMTGSTIAVIGIVGFIGLAAPHVARFMVGSDHRFAVPVTATVGGLITLLSDICVRLVSMYVAGLGELPLGVVTSVVGAPFLAYLVIKRARE